MILKWKMVNGKKITVNPFLMDFSFFEFPKKKKKSEFLFCLKNEEKLNRNPKGNFHIFFHSSRFLLFGMPKSNFPIFSIFLMILVFQLKSFFFFAAQQKNFLGFLEGEKLGESDHF
jgi:hypothetical protein